MILLLRVLYACLRVCESVRCEVSLESLLRRRATPERDARSVQVTPMIYERRTHRLL